jgi:hypothetical protein
VSDQFGLSGLPTLGGGRSRSISAENPDGRRGGGGMAASPLGTGRKGRPCIPLAAGETATLAAIAGAGVITHIWCTVAERSAVADFVLRDIVLRAWWDDEERPSVEVPLGDFFCNGFGRRASVTSLPIVVAPAGGMNCYFPMPFATGARITVTSEHPADLDAFFYQIDYLEVDAIAEDSGTFHAQWRRSPVTEPGRDHVIVDGVRGRGKYVGTYLAIAALQRHWYGEGEVKFYLDGDEHPTICGTGTEDYVGGAWSFQAGLREGDARPTTYSSPFLGYPFHAPSDGSGAAPHEGTVRTVPMHGLYRWHLPDPIHFERDLRVAIQQIGHDGRELFERSDDVSSVAYWYQAEPHAPFPHLPDPPQRRPR